MIQYQKVVDMDEGNAFGVLGIANILTEYNKVHESKEVYKLLQNCETDPVIILHAMLNQAHLLINEENQEIAINLYQAAHQRFPNDKKIQLFLCKSYYRQKQYDKAIKMTEKLIARYPNEIRLKYNLALCLNDRANAVFNLKHRKVVQTKQAIKDCGDAKALF